MSRPGERQPTRPKSGLYLYTSNFPVIMDAGKRLRDPDLPDDEAERILGAFIQQSENRTLSKRWADKLATEHGVNRTPGSGRTRRLPGGILYYLAAAAAVIALVLFALPQLNSPRGTDLLAEALSDTELTTSRSANDGAVGALRGKMINAFNADNFSEAIDHGEALAATSAATNDDRLSLAIIYLNAEDYTSALATLTSLNTETDTLAAEVDYYSGLAYLGSGQWEQGRRALRKLSPETGGRYYRSAQKLLQAQWGD